MFSIFLASFCRCVRKEEPYNAFSIAQKRSGSVCLSWLAEEESRVRNRVVGVLLSLRHRADAEQSPLEAASVAVVLLEVVVRPSHAMEFTGESETFGTGGIGAWVSKDVKPTSFNFFDSLEGRSYILELVAQMA